MAARYQMTTEVRDEIINQLTDVQQNFLLDHMKRGQRTIFARIMAAQKGIMIPDEASFEDIEQLLSEWVYIGYVDAGSRSKEYPCECGLPLRYQHTVLHLNTKEIRKFGIDHLQQHTGIDASTVQKIQKGFNAIDYELTEIAWKIKQGWRFSQVVEAVPYDLAYPADIQVHLDLQLPLLDRQISRLRKLIEQHSVYKPEPPKPIPRPVPKLIKKQTPQFDPQISFDFFNNNRTLPVEPVQMQPAEDPLELALSLQEPVLAYLAEGVQSARVICELLIQKHRAPNRRYLSDKPHIFVPVCMFIDDHLVVNERCRLLSKDTVDRMYEWVGP